MEPSEFIAAHNAGLFQRERRVVLHLLGPVSVAGLVESIVRDTGGIAGLMLTVEADPQRVETFAGFEQVGATDVKSPTRTSLYVPRSSIIAVEGSPLVDESDEPE